MLSNFTDNAMNLGSINDRREVSIVNTSMIRGLERFVGHILRDLLAPVFAGRAHSMCVVRAAARGCQQRFISKKKRWQPGLSGYSPQGHGLPAGTGVTNAG
ncbi:MAG: hypothetical protein ACR2NU_13900 [Aeoliella sp.]